MSNLWIPSYDRVDLGPDGGTYDEMRHPKGGLHTTEGTSIAGAETAFRNYPPHICYDPVRRTKRQYIRLDRCSYAYKNSESDDEYIIQIELVGFARQTHLWPDELYKHIAEDVIKPLEDLVGIPRSYLRFHGEGEGIILASPNSPIRITASELRNYSGWLGHQHVPAPDSHWDPGRFLITKCFRHLDSLLPPDSPIEKREDMSVRLQRGDSTDPDENGVPWGHRVFMVKYDPMLPDGAIRVYMSNNAVYRSLLKAQGSVDQLPQGDLDAIPVFELPEEPV